MSVAISQHVFHSVGNTTCQSYSIMLTSALQNFREAGLQLTYPLITQIIFRTHLNKQSQFLCIVQVNLNCFPFQAPISIIMLLMTTNPH